MFIQKMADYAKENWLTTAGGAATAIIAIITGLWSIDEHYAKAADLSKVEQKVDANTRNMTLELQIQLNNQSARDLKGKIADIEDKEAAKKADAVDAVKKQRLLRDLADIQRETNMLTRQKFEAPGAVTK